VAGRGDGKLEDYGKVADLVQTDSPLQVGLRGKYKGVSFEITGRTQLQHAAGGVWDEWYVAFRGGKKWGWLAEAQGKLVLTFPKKMPGEFEAPAFDELDIEQGLVIPTMGEMVVSEIGEAKTISAEGEIPYILEPNSPVIYADLSGSGAKFATIDWSDGDPVVYIGGEITFEKLGLADAIDREKLDQRVSAKQVNCPSCGGALEIQVPDKTERVICQYCGAMNECNNGDLKFLKALGDIKVAPAIPLGTEGYVDGERFQVIGHMLRSVTYENLNYPWQEYLLYRPRAPFCWLIQSNGHWSFGKPISVGDVQTSARLAHYQGRTFKIFEHSEPVVDQVLGEFYWKVEVGEQTRSSDFISPPFMLSREKSEVSAEEREGGSQSSEVNYTLGKYIPKEDIESGFGVSDLRPPTGVAPNQPYPYSGIFKLWMLMLAASIFAVLVVMALGSRKQIYSKTIALKRTTSAKNAVIYSEPFEISRFRNIKVTCYSPVNNSWVYVSGNFFNEETGLIQSFNTEIYKGGGEGSTTSSQYVTALPKGKYTLRIAPQWKNMARVNGPNLKVTVQQGVPRILNAILLLVAISIVPICMAIHRFSFEATRWKDSEFNPYASGE